MPAAIGLAVVGLSDIWKDEYLVFDGKWELTVIAIHTSVCVAPVHASVFFEATTAANIFKKKKKIQWLWKFQH